MREANAAAGRRAACARRSVLCALLSAAVHTGAMGADPSAERGKELYATGVSPSGNAITSFFGEDRLELPGEAATCDSCHGHDGTGRPESGIVPTNITWEYLTKSYGHVHEGGVKHGPFTKETLAHYMRTGIYPGGARGDPAMPVYEIYDDDLADLIAYLERLGHEPDPGVSDTSIRVATVVPAGGPLAETGRAIRAALEAYFADLNADGGVYGRRFELVTHELAADLASARSQTQAWLEQARPFALVGTFTPGMDREVASFFSEQGIPLVGPFNLYSVESFASNRQVFYVFSGLGDQLRSLVRFADARLDLKDPAVAILYPDVPALAEVVTAAERACEEAGWRPLRRPFPRDGFDAAAATEELRQASVEVVVSLTVEKELGALLASAAQQDWLPYVLAPGSLSGGALSEAPASMRPRVYLAYATLPSDRKPEALREVDELMVRTRISRSHLQGVVSTFAAATILTEATRRAGRVLDRHALTAALEEIYRFDTGLTPPITYSRNRRVGARGSYILGGPPRPGSERDFSRPIWIEPAD